MVGVSYQLPDQEDQEEISPSSELIFADTGSHGLPQSPGTCGRTTELDTSNPKGFRNKMSGGAYKGM